MRKWLVLGVVLGTALMSPVSSAYGAPVSCGYTYLQPFAAWGDRGNYALAPAGSFEQGAPGWTLTGGAAVGGPGNPLRGESSANSLSLPAGSAATTPPICVEAGSPWSRVFAQTVVRKPGYTKALQVELLYTDARTGKTTIRPAGTLTQRDAWAPAEPMSLGSPLTIKQGRDGRTTVQYRFTPLYGSVWRIDDLYIDPKRK